MTNDIRELTVSELDAVAGGHFHHFKKEHTSTFEAAQPKSSIANTADDTPLNYLGLFNADG